MVLSLVILGLYGDNEKENGNYYIIWGYIGVIYGLYWGLLKIQNVNSRASQPKFCLLSQPYPSKITGLWVLVLSVLDQGLKLHVQGDYG